MTSKMTDEANKHKLVSFRNDSGGQLCLPIVAHTNDDGLCRVSRYDRWQDGELRELLCDEHGVPTGSPSLPIALAARLIVESDIARKNRERGSLDPRHRIKL